MLPKIAALLLLNGAFASPVERQLQRRDCPDIHVFGARETTAPSGFGLASTVVDLILNAHQGATAEAIDYPATGHHGRVDYVLSVQSGVAAVASQISFFAGECPDTKIVVVGYSQGSQIVDDAMCGGGDSQEGIPSTESPVSSQAASMVKAIILMGDPRHVPGVSYDVGTSTHPGFDPRPSGFECEYSDLIQSYCDQDDPFCSNGDSLATHNGYGQEYGQAALKFVNEKLA